MFGSRRTWPGIFDTPIKAISRTVRGRRIVLGTDRPIAFAEARNSTRSMDYPFRIIEIHLDKADQGVGKILAGTKLFIDKSNNLVLEQFGQQPVRFNEIKKVR
jgi:hypothetical protein